MGRISEFACPSCNMTWEIRLGHGIGHAVLESVLNEFPADIQKKILVDMEGEQIPFFEFNYHLAVCEQCKKIVSVPSIYLHQRGHSYVAMCPDCGSAVLILDENTEITCPCCKNAVLNEKEIGSWD